MRNSNATNDKSLLTRIIIFAAIGWTAIMVIFYFWSVETKENEIYRLAKRQARAFFQEIVTTRSWNARHGGVYVPVTSVTQPNPYLKVADRDVVTEDGMKLTKINPAFMTRQIAEIASQENMVIFHITSAKPIRPGNAPDPWELKALKGFRTGSNEASELMEDGSGERVFRYMAPLWVEKSCLQCHKVQGYRLGDLRGGISVTVNAEPMLLSLKKGILNTAITYGSIWVIGLLGMLGCHHLLRRQEQGRLNVINDLERTEATLRDERDRLKIALKEIKTLSGLLPICASCKKIRDDEGYWRQIESYIGEHSNAEFSHGICPDCAKKLYPDLNLFED